MTDRAKELREFIAGFDHTCPNCDTACEVVEDENGYYCQRCGDGITSAEEDDARDELRKLEESKQ